MLFLEHGYWGAAEAFRASLGKNGNERNLPAYHPPPPRLPLLWLHRSAVEILPIYTTVQKERI